MQIKFMDGSLEENLKMEIDHYRSALRQILAVMVPNEMKGIAQKALNKYQDQRRAAIPKIEPYEPKSLLK